MAEKHAGEANQGLSILKIEQGNTLINRIS
jgi:hypothetical protein